VGDIVGLTIGSDVGAATAAGLGSAVNTSEAVVVGARLADGDGDAADSVASGAPVDGAMLGGSAVVL